MTEADAKTKWCPMVRFTEASITGDHRYTAHNRYEDVNMPVTQAYPYNRCIASDCMMLQWWSASTKHGLRYWPDRETMDKLAEPGERCGVDCGLKR